MSDSSTVNCSRYNSYSVNNRTFFQISNKYEGIPQNLGVNVPAYIILIGLFLLIRKKAWNYGKLAWFNKHRNRQITLSNDESPHDDEGDIVNTRDKNPLNGVKHESICQKFINILPLFVKMSDEDLRKRCGADAVIYCQFQRYLMVTVAVMMFFSLTLILPVNIYGGSYNDTSQFKTLTIQNITSKTFLWVHFCVSVVFMLFAFILSTRFLRKIDIKFKDKISPTLMIDNVPIDWCDELSIRKHFLEAFPSIKVKRVEITIKVDKLKEIRSEKVYAEEALNFCCDEWESKHERIMVVPRACGRMMVCRCCASRCATVDGVEYYSEEVIRLTDLFIAEKSNATINHKLPIVFVTFDTVQQAMLVRRDYIYENYFCLNKPPKHTSSLSADLKSSTWNVKFAPNATDVIWENLHKRGWRWIIPVILVNLVVAFVVIVLSTPAMVLNIMESVQFKKTLDVLQNPFMKQIIPALILVVVNSWMPVIVCFSDQVSGHWTNTTRSLAIMNKLYAILVITILVLPSLGLNSVSALFTWLSHKQNGTTNERFQLQCIFMPDGGALFCNYIITASFIGTALELLRLGDLFFYMFKICYSKSRAEDQEISKSVSLEFQFSLGYAWTLALFTMVSAYAVIVPIITPFGLTYLVLKHMVDRYNLIHVNIPSEINNSIHTNAAQLMQIGLILTQATVAVYINLRETKVGDPLFVLCCIAFFVGVLLTFGRTIRRWIIGMSWYKYSGAMQSLDSIGPVVNGAVSVCEDEDFILVDHTKDAVFVPYELTIDVTEDDKNVARRKSMISQ